jgi:hypothetical protein
MRTGLTLIDAGLPRSEKKILAYIASLSPLSRAAISW